MAEADFGVAGDGHGEHDAIPDGHGAERNSGGGLQPLRGGGG